MPGKVLVIDDDAHVVKTVRSRLEAGGCAVATASSGAEGLESVKRERPDLIIVDVMMPEMDGYTFVQNLKRLPGCKKIPVIVLTVKDKMREMFEMEGVKDYMLKPFKGEELMERVNGYLPYKTEGLT